MSPLLWAVAALLTYAFVGAPVLAVVVGRRLRDMHK